MERDVIVLYIIADVSFSFALCFQGRNPDYHSL